jgi:hypothetical protein
MATATTRKPAAAKATAAKVAEAEPVESEQQIKNRLRNEAEREVIDRHRGELHEIAEAKFKAAGLVYTRRKTEQEKAEDKIKALLEQFPELAGTFTAVPVTPDVDPEEGPGEDGPVEGYDPSLGYGVDEEPPSEDHGWPADDDRP